MALGTNIYDIYFWGIICQDLILRLNAVPRGDRGAAILEETTAIGGDAANSAAAASRLGLKVVLQTNHLGRDAIGNFIMDELRQRKQAVVRMTRNNLPTVHAYALALPDGQRTILGSFKQNRISPADRGMIRRSRVFCFDGYYDSGIAPALATAKRAGTLIIANDVMPTAPHFPLIDYIVLSAPDDGLKRAERFLAAAKRRTPGTVIVTMGKRGAIALDSAGKRYRQKGFPVEVADSTGAGDCFRASFIYGQLKGWDIKRCLRFAGGFAALSCRGIGGGGYLPSAVATEKFIRQV